MIIFQFGLLSSPEWRREKYSKFWLQNQNSLTKRNYQGYEY